ncbi:MAG: PadR family transcriptional regulator [Gemmatimonadaceae bacterium]|nr:PadR family transcriptional regulator [Gemmatimonadaceae bacterium]
MWNRDFCYGPGRDRRGRREGMFAEFVWGGRRRRGGWGGRMFEQGDLKYVILQLLAEKPRHGYEIIKALEEKSGGAYAPSAGAIYPTLTLLEDMGFAVSSQESGGKKVYTITEAGRAYLDENRSTVEDVFERIGEIGSAFFSDGVRDVGRAFGQMAKATFGASPEQLRDSATSRRVIEAIQRASREIDEILHEARARRDRPAGAAPNEGAGGPA